MALFFHCFPYSASSQGRTPARTAAGTLIAFGLALLSKESALITPLLLACGPLLQGRTPMPFISF
jgi:hypothetical protein